MILIYNLYILGHRLASLKVNVKEERELVEDLKMSSPPESRVSPDTDLAGYPAKSKYRLICRISGLISDTLNRISGRILDFI